MGLIWEESMKTGVTWQDAQHEALFEKINGLFDAMKRCEGKQEIDEMVRFLEGYIAKHFGDEEAAMKRCRYPESDSHFEAHSRFKKMISDFKIGIEGGASTSQLVKAQIFLFDWYRNHVCKTDKELGEFLIKRDVAF
jgi:hemerythrin